MSILKLFYKHNELLHVSANHVAIFRDVTYKILIHRKYKIKIIRTNA